MISSSFEISLLKWDITHIELFEKNAGMFDLIILHIDLALNKYCLRSWDYSAHALRYAIVFFEKKNCYWFVLLLVTMWYLYEYWDSNGWWKFIGKSIYKIIEDHSVTSSQTKNGRIKLYLVIMKVKKSYLYEMINCG